MICKTCNREIVKKLAQEPEWAFRHRAYCSRSCESGVAVNDLGLSPSTKYLRVQINGGMKQKHRHVVEQAIGRALTGDEIVHHRNGDKLDNRLENLEIMSHKDHAEHHLRIHPDTNKCVVCGNDFYVSAVKRGGRQKTCGPVCLRVRKSEAAKESHLGRHGRNLSSLLGDPASSEVNK